MMNKIEFPAVYELHISTLPTEKKVEYTGKDEDNNDVERSFTTYSVNGLLMSTEYGEDRATQIRLTVDNTSRYGRLTPLALMQKMIPHLADITSGKKICLVEVDHIFAKRGDKDDIALNVLIPYLKDIKFVDATEEDLEFIETMRPLLNA